MWYTTADTQPKGPLIHLLVIHQQHRKLWKERREVLIADATYNTNKFNMPAWNIVGFNKLGRRFVAGTCLFPGEDERSFLKTLDFVKDECDQSDIVYPKVVLIDADAA